ncbi:MAG: glycoside hydrolase family 15 protein [Dehalococcoidia bacterium]
MGPDTVYKPGRIEDYALIGDLETAALVSNRGSLDWLCLPRFDSPACFAALLGDESNGRWLIEPHGEFKTTRRYRDDTLILETRFETSSGAITLVDFMPIKDPSQCSSIVRLVRGERGSVAMHTDITMRFDYGHTVPWVQRTPAGILALSGPNAASIVTPVNLSGHNFHTTGEFVVNKGDVVPFVMSYHNSLEQPESIQDPELLCDYTAAWWTRWSSRILCQGPYRDHIVRSVITLKALTHQPSGGIVAAATTSLPEEIGGERNWDYRFCWLRDATFTLYALLSSGLTDEALHWRDWLVRVAAGKPDQLQSLYGPTGERLLPEFNIEWLAGYEASSPVRVGNEASKQLQVDIYGEVMDVFHVSRRSGIRETPQSWALQQALIDFLESGWRKADSGIWEVRGRRRHFTHSKVMAWVGVDRAVKAVERHGLDGPVDKWRALRQKIQDDILKRGYDPNIGAFTQYYGSGTVDAALLLIPMVGFLPAHDPRVLGTISAIEKHLLHDGLVYRYRPKIEVEGVTGGESAFLPCSFWLADNYLMSGRREKAAKLYEHLLTLTNDVGLISEEYDPRAGRMLGNFPQAFTHVSLVNTAQNLVNHSPVEHRASG